MCQYHEDDYERDFQPLKDPIELGEARAERWEERFKNGKYHCPCGNIVPDNELETISSDPYAEPFCFQCFENWVDGRHKDT